MLAFWLHLVGKYTVPSSTHKANTPDIAFTLNNVPMLTFDLIYLENYHHGTDSYISFGNPLFKRNNLICNKAMFC